MKSNPLIKEIQISLIMSGSFIIVKIFGLNFEWIPSRFVPHGKRKKDRT